MRRVLGTDFFSRPALVVAKELVGKYLVRHGRAYVITETEAYFGYEDRGSHAFRGKTSRNAPMYEAAGTIYVYFTYGMHWMLNIVCDKRDFPAAVLIRGVRDDEGHHDGPGKLTRALHIDKMLSGKKLGRTSGIWIEDRGFTIQRGALKRTARIGIPNRGEWTDKPWRFVLNDARKKPRRRSAPRLQPKASR